MAHLFPPTSKTILQHEDVSAFLDLMVSISDYNPIAPVLPYKCSPV